MKKFQMKSCVSVLLAFVLLFNLSSAFAAGSDPEEDSVLKNDSFISATLENNKELMGAISKNSAVKAMNSLLDISIEPNNSIASIELTNNDVLYNIDLQGELEEVAVGDLIGYAGEFEGFVCANSNDEVLSAVSTTEMPVTANVTIADSDVFVVLTIGYAGEDSIPIVIMYGDITNSIGRIENEQYRIATSNNPDSLIDMNQTQSVQSVDGTTRLQGYALGYCGTYACGELSVFHANQLKNQGNMSTCVKVNSNTPNMRSYVENTMGFGSSVSSVLPDIFKISISGNHNDFHALANSYLPQNNSTSATITVPYYAGATLGVQTVSFDMLMSSTTVTPSKYSSSSIHPNNKLDWEVYKRWGWDPSVFDGTHSMSKGMTAYGTYTYEGNVSSNITRSMTASATIGYDCYVMIGGVLTGFRVTTEAMSKTTNVTICP